MWLIAIAALILAAPFGLAFFISRNTSHLKMADMVWGRLEEHAHALLQDKTLPSLVGDLVEEVVNHTGDGSLTRSFLLSLLFRPRSSESAISSAVDDLHEGQRSQFMRFVIMAILYDSLKTSFSGILLRRIVLYWLVPTAKDQKAPVNSSQVGPIARAAGRAYHVPC